MPVPKGQRYGGRKKGTPNKVTLERAVAVRENLKASGQTAALDELRELARYHKSKGAQFQPQFAQAKDENGNPVVDRDGKPMLTQIGGDAVKSNEHLQRAEHILIAIIPYETPKLQSTTLRGDANPDAPPIQVRVKFV